MAKSKTVFFCKNCGVESAKWIGKCPACNEWNTYAEHKVSKTSQNTITAQPSQKKSKPQPFSEIQAENYDRITTGISELDRILGGGLVPGSFTLLGGEPGIGKSTLALQLALATEKKILYVSGEESGGQIKMRAERIGQENTNCLVYNETQLEEILAQIENENPSILIIDSIQTIYSTIIDSAPGSVTQVRECASTLLQIAKNKVIPVILIGHITKDGSLAGPKVLEHIVDTVIQFEGDQNLQFRVLRTLKNRFGAVPELAIFEMDQNGLKEILNPSSYFIHQTDSLLSGIAISCSLEGIKPLLIETQALVSAAVYGTPQRVATGFDARRLNMLLAVLEKRAGLPVSNKDIFLNIAGGLKLNDPAVDLAIITAIVSSQTDRAIGAGICCCAEVSLTGELKPASRIETRIAEASKLGFKQMVISSYHSEIIKTGGLEILKASTLREALKQIFQAGK